MGLNIKEIAMLVGGTFLLLDRGASWMFILGVALLAVGANRIARNI